MLIKEEGIGIYLNKKFFDKLYKIAEIGKNETVGFIPCASIIPCIGRLPHESIGINYVPLYPPGVLQSINAMDIYSKPIHMSKFRKHKWRRTPYAVVIRKRTPSGKTITAIWNETTAAISHALVGMLISTMNTINQIANSGMDPDLVFELYNHMYGGVWEMEHVTEIQDYSKLMEQKTSPLIIQTGGNFIFPKSVPLLQQYNNIICKEL